MAKHVFFRKEGDNPVVIATCDDFQQFCLSLSHKEQASAFGNPYGKPKWKVHVLQKPSSGWVNPFWVNTFNCSGEEVGHNQIVPRKRRPRHPIDEPPSGDDDSSGRRPKSKPCSCASNPACCDAKPRKNWHPSMPLRIQNGDYDRTGGNLTINGYGGVNPKNESHIVARRRETKSSVKTPGFKSYARRDLPWNNFSSTKLHLWEEPGFKGIVGRPACDGTWFTASGFVRGYGTPPQCIDYVDYVVPRHLNTPQRALQQALLRAKSMKINLGQTFGERKQTVNLLYSNVNKLLALALALRKGNVEGARKLLLGSKGKDSVTQVSVLNREGTRIINRRYVHVRAKAKRSNVTPKEFANLWLEFQYGWRPLLSDIHGACETIANTYHKRKPMEVTAVVQAEQTVDKVYQGWRMSGTVVCSPLQPATFGDRRKTVYRSRTKVKLQFREDDQWSASMSKVGLADPALIAWELMPWSFVIDWFVPVGNYLESLNALVGLNFLRGSTSTTTSAELTSTPVVVIRGFGTMDSTVRGVALHKNRSVYSSVPALSPPAFQPNLGVEKVISALSLLTQVFARGKTTVRT